GACAGPHERLLAAGEVVRLAAGFGADADTPDAGMDAAGLEAVFAVPRVLFAGLDALGEVLDHYKMLRGTDEAIRRRFVLVYAILFGAVLLAASGVSVWLARRLIRRLRTVTVATRQVAAGNLDVRVPSEGRDEIADLARSFNEMVSELRDSRDRIVYLQRVSAWQGLARRLAHEIKNPLTPIQLAIQEVAEKYVGTDERYRKLLAAAREVIEEEVATLRRMTTEFSEFARLPKVQAAPAELRDFIDACEAAFSPTAAAAGVETDWRKPPTGIVVAIDRQLMRRVVDNLVRNAVEAIRGRGASRPVDPSVALAAAPAGRVEVVAGAPPGSRWAEIVIRDDGPGIPDDIREHLFEPHFTTKRTGTGLGLAIVKKIVLEHGGEISLEPSRSGAAFRITLPLSDIPPGEPSPGAAASEGRGGDVG
ncbi:MAG: HAMP domain-containing sensor histidine kinase, partial [Myxococcota bacterium]|nr:HAMP domain-containing sensor histidine kinase [Myxococcota bacterium]